MTSLHLSAPSRLHFGLLARGPAAPRQFGGLGLMVEEPGLEITAEPSDSWRASGPLADRAGTIARRVAAKLIEDGKFPPPLALTVHRAPPEHVGLGTGTQLSLAVAKLVTMSAGLDLSAPALAAVTGRGARSGVGLHGFDHGGLIVEGGHRGESGIPPLLSRMDWPAEWSVLVVVPPVSPGLHGPDEMRAFSALPPMPEAETDRLCRLVLLGILPAVAERNLAEFGEALSELQHRVGSWFAPAQGGVFASPRITEIVGWLRAEGLSGVGQSSWGPALYGVSRDGPERRDSLARSLRSRFALDAGSVLWTAASPRGAVLRDR
ncbi:MAG: beta-RFAP synthase [Planctomycetota bacterium]|nr:beta-RFAP synthase [Planctomycetota bacterium]